MKEMIATFRAGSARVSGSLLPSLLQNGLGGGSFLLSSSLCSSTTKKAHAFHPAQQKQWECAAGGLSEEMNLQQGEIFRRASSPQIHHLLRMASKLHGRFLLGETYAFFLNPAETHSHEQSIGEV